MTAGVQQESQQLLILRVSILLRVDRSNERIESLAEYSFDEISRESERLRFIGNLQFEVEAARGSVRVRAKIWATVLSVGMFFDHYDGIRDGVPKFYHDVLAIGRDVADAVRGHEDVDKKLVHVYRRAPLAKSLLSLFERVKRHELTPEQATNIATEILLPAVESKEELDRFRSAFYADALEVYKIPVPLDRILYRPRLIAGIEEQRTLPKPPMIPKPSVPAEPGFRVSIVGDSIRRRKERIE